MAALFWLAALAEFCREYGADYLVIDNGFFITAKDSRRYKADKLGEFDPGCAVFRANGYTVFRVTALP